MAKGTHKLSKRVLAELASLDQQPHPSNKKRGRPKKPWSAVREENLPSGCNGKAWARWYEHYRSALASGLGKRDARKRATHSVAVELQRSERRVQQIVRRMLQYFTALEERRKRPRPWEKELREREEVRKMSESLTTEYGCTKGNRAEVIVVFMRERSARIAAESRVAELEVELRALKMQFAAQTAVSIYASKRGRN